MDVSIGNGLESYAPGLLLPRNSSTDIWTCPWMLYDSENSKPNIRISIRSHWTLSYVPPPGMCVRFSSNKTTHRQFLMWLLSASCFTSHKRMMPGSGVLPGLLCVRVLLKPLFEIFVGGCGELLPGQPVFSGRAEANASNLRLA